VLLAISRHEGAAYNPRKLLSLTEPTKDAGVSTGADTTKSYQLGQAASAAQGVELSFGARVAFTEVFRRFDADLDGALSQVRVTLISTAARLPRVTPTALLALTSSPRRRPVAARAQRLPAHGARRGAGAGNYLRISAVDLLLIP